MTVDARRPDRTRATLIGLVNQYGSVALAMLQGVVLVPTYLDHIDERTYGAWLASGNVIAWLAFIDPGVSGVIQQRVAAAYGRRDFDRVTRSLGTGLAINFSFGAVVGTLGLLLAPFVPSLTRLDADLARPISINFALAAVSEAALLWALALASVPMALMARPIAVGLCYQLCTLFGIGATVVLLRAGVGLPSIPLGLMARAVTLLISNAVLARGALRDLTLRPRFSREELREVFGLSGYTWISRLGTNLLQNVDAVLVSRSLGAAMVPPLTLTRRAADVLSQLTTRMAAAFAPALSHVHGEGDLERLRSVSLRLLRVVAWTSALGLAGFVGLNRSFVALWVGPRFFGGLTLTALFGLSLLWQSIASVLQQTLFSVGAIRQTSVITLGEALLKVAAIALLLRLGFGLSSAPLGALLAGMGFALLALGRTFARVMAMAPGEGARLVAGTAAQALLMLALGGAFARWAPSAPNVTVFCLHAVVLGAAAVATLAAVNPSMRDELAELAARVRARRG